MVIGATLLAFVTYTRARFILDFDPILDFVPEYYHHVFAMFHGFTLAFPSFDFDLSIAITMRPYEGQWGRRSCLPGQLVCLRALSACMGGAARREEEESRDFSSRRGQNAGLGDYEARGRCGAARGCTVWLLQGAGKKCHALLELLRCC